MERSSPIDESGTIDGRQFIRCARAVWVPPDGPFCYADFTMRPETLAFDATPGA